MKVKHLDTLFFTNVVLNIVFYCAKKVSIKNHNWESKIKNLNSVKYSSIS